MILIPILMFTIIILELFSKIVMAICIAIANVGVFIISIIIVESFVIVVLVSLISGVR